MTHRTSPLPRATLAVFCLVALSACMDSGSLFPVQMGGALDPDAIRGSFAGCVAGNPLDTSRAQVTFEFPESSSRVSVYRNGTLIFSTDDRAVNSFIDSGLDEGQSYIYTCEGIINGRVFAGTRALNVTTLSLSTPVFNGITSATALSSSSVRVTWGPTLPGSVAAQGYKLYYNPGSTVDFTKPAKRDISLGAFSFTVTGLGDEIPYAFAVRACSAGGLCETNTAARTATPPDSGAPRSTGATAVAAQNGALRITAPWAESDGAIQRRHIYIRNGATGGTDLSNYTLQQTAYVTNLGAPPTLLTVSNGIAEFQTYHVIVVDEDPSGQRTTLREVASISTGDLTAPVFAGISSAVAGTNAQSQLNVSFVALDRQNAGENLPTGVSAYLLYLTQAAFPGNPTDPCLQNTPYLTQLADPFAPGAQSLPLSGLSARTTYKLCMQARDNAGNRSQTTNFVTITTLDTTAPAFDGLQSLTFNPETARLELAWNPSSASDILRYSIKLWRNNADPALGMGLTMLSRTHASSAMGTTVSLTEFPIADNDTVYVQVEACDTAGSLPGGSENCSTGSAIRNRLLPDISPPPGFVGIRPSGDLESTVSGEVVVKWFAPAVWTDYRGFRVYSVNTDFSLNFLRDCGCPTTDCSATGGYTQCTVTGLNPYRTYKLHVRAYDAAGNLTILDPTNAIKVATKRVADTTPPQFSSGLVLGPKPTYTLNFNSATDNQYSLEPGAELFYEVFRKAGTPFATPTNPAADGSQRGAVTTLSFTDSGLVQGTSYFYTVCARDSSSNRTCDGTIRSFTVSDAAPPTISTLASTKTSSPKRKNWNLSWALSDNVSAAGAIRVNVYSKVSTPNALPSFAPEDSGVTLLASGVGLTSLSGLVGPPLQNAYVNYRVEAIDAEDNIGAGFFSVYSDNALTITSVAPTEGKITGGKLMYLQGTGFRTATDTGCATGTRVWFGTPGLPESECTSVTILDDRRLSCITPAKPAGAVTVTVSHPDADSSCTMGSQAPLPSAFTYASATSNICDEPSSWASATGGAFANQGVGVGDTEGSPFILCGAQHLQNLNLNTGAAGFKYYKLGANIDLKDYDFSPLAFSSATANLVLSLDGGGHAIFNYGINSAGTDFSRQSGLISVNSVAVSQTLTLKNLSLINARVKRTTAASAAIGLLSNQAQLVDFSNLVVIGELIYGYTSTDPKVGGVIGIVGASNGSWIRDSAVQVKISTEGAVTLDGNSRAGGVVGQGTSSFDRVTADVDIASSATAAGRVFGQTGGIIGNWSISQGTHNCPTERCGASEIRLRGKMKVKNQAGGIAGGINAITVYTQDWLIQKSHVILDVESLNTGSVGGIAGQLGTNVPHFYRVGAEGSIRSPFAGSYVGGIIGLVNGQAPSTGVFANQLVIESYSKANLEVAGASNNIGGIVGRAYFGSGSGGGYRDPAANQGLGIRDCYVEGSLREGQKSGGLVGQSAATNVPTSGPQYNLVVNRSYATPAMIYSSYTPFGILSDGVATTALIQRSFWNQDSAANGGTGVSLAAPATLELAPGSNPLAVTTATLADQNVFTGWDFNNVWYMDAATGRPKLRWARDAGLNP